MCFTKFLLFATNIITFVIGAIVIAFASIFISKGQQYGELLFEGVLTVPILILIFGIFITIVGLLGCLGALRENSCMLNTYAAIVLALLIGTVALGIILLAFPGKVEEKLEASMMKSFAKYGKEDEALTKVIDTTQSELKCCGVNGFDDWHNWYDVDDEVPKSCCIEPTEGCNKVGRRDQGTMNIYKNGCLNVMVDKLQDITLALGISTICLCIIMCINISSACVIARKQKN